MAENSLMNSPPPGSQGGVPIPQPREGQYGYWEKVQTGALREEVELIQAELAGKIKTINQDGETVFVFPIETKVYVEYFDESGKRHLLDERTRAPEAWQPTKRKFKADKEIQNPFCTPEGQRAIMGFVAPKLSAGTPLSNYEAESVRKNCLMDGVTLWKMIQLNMDEWEIDPARAESVIMTILDRIEAARSRSVDDLERQHTGRNTSVATVVQGIAKSAGLPFTGSFGNQPKRM